MSEAYEYKEETKLSPVSEDSALRTDNKPLNPRNTTKGIKITRMAAVKPALIPDASGRVQISASGITTQPAIPVAQRSSERVDGGMRLSRRITNLGKAERKLASDLRQ